MRINKYTLAFVVIVMFSIVSYRVFAIIKPNNFQSGKENLYKNTRTAIRYIGKCFEQDRELDAKEFKFIKTYLTEYQNDDFYSENNKYTAEERTMIDDVFLAYTQLKHYSTNPDNKNNISQKRIGQEICRKYN